MSRVHDEVHEQVGYGFTRLYDSNAQLSLPFTFGGLEPATAGHPHHTHSQVQPVSWLLPTHTVITRHFQ